MIHLEQIPYAGWQNCYRFSNGLIELIITGDVGPRIIRFGFVGKENQFAELPEQLGQTGGNEWRLYGGHRFWHAPEEPRRTYYPDNAPVTVQEHEGFVRVIQQPESTTGLQKEMDIRIWLDEAQVRVTHRLRNLNLWGVEVAPWALSVMAPGGTAVLPLPTRLQHGLTFLPSSALVIWPYTELNDPRWHFGREHIFLRQDPGRESPQKIGLAGAPGWAAYQRGHDLFISWFMPQPEAVYPDMGSRVEFFTNNLFLEVETLGPLTKLPPGGVVEHVEKWALFHDVPLLKVGDGGEDTAVRQQILPRLLAVKPRATGPLN
jgi:hypothetical protein